MTNEASRSLACIARVHAHTQLVGKLTSELDINRRLLPVSSGANNSTDDDDAADDNYRPLVRALASELEFT